MSLSDTFTSPLENEPDDSENGEDGKPNQNERSEFEVELTPELLSAFTTSLSDQHIALRFFAGSWASLASSPTSFLHEAGEEGRIQFDIVLTSETIYRTQSLPSLLSALYLASTGPPAKSPISEQQALCLVAAKVVYFGVGGGTSEFVHALESADQAAGGVSGVKGEADTVWDQTRGVARKVMRVRWSNNVP